MRTAMMVIKLPFSCHGGTSGLGSGTQIGKYGVFRRTGIGFRFQILLLYPETHQGAA